LSLIVLLAVRPSMLLLNSDSRHRHYCEKPPFSKLYLRLFMEVG
jgi:hypothetical protein